MSRDRARLLEVSQVMWVVACQVVRDPLTSEYASEFLIPVAECLSALVPRACRRLCAELGTCRAFGLAAGAGAVKVCRWMAMHLSLSVPEVVSSSALELACEDGRLETLEWLCAEFRFEARNVMEGRNTALGLCCKGGHLNVARLLESTFGLAAIRAQGTYDLGVSDALAAACAGGHTDTARWLVQTFRLTKSDALPREPFDSQEFERSPRPCALWEACIGGHLETARWLVDTLSIARDDVRTLKWATALNTVGRCCERGKLREAVWLEETFALSDFDDDDHSSLREVSVALARACRGSIAVVSWLVETFSPPPRMVSLHWAIGFAAESHNLDTVKWLLENFFKGYVRMLESDEDCFTSACYNGDLRFVEWVVDVLDVSHKCSPLSETLQSALHSACVSGSLEVVTWLVETWPEEFKEVPPDRLFTAHTSASCVSWLLTWLRVSPAVVRLSCPKLWCLLLMNNEPEDIQWLVDEGYCPNHVESLASDDQMGSEVDSLLESLCTEDATGKVSAVVDMFDLPPAAVLPYAFRERSVPIARYLASRHDFSASGATRCEALEEAARTGDIDTFRLAMALLNSSEEEIRELCPQALRGSADEGSTSLAEWMVQSLGFTPEDFKGSLRGVLKCCCRRDDVVFCRWVRETFGITPDLLLSKDKRVHSLLEIADGDTKAWFTTELGLTAADFLALGVSEEDMDIESLFQ